MAHKEKYTRGAVGHMLGHYDRSKEVPELACPANTVLNYNLASNDQQKNQLDFLHQRLSEVKVHNRKDVNVRVDWVVTLPQSLNNRNFDDEERFFKETYKFLNERYGKENVISAYVHFDEVTPHMHYAFVPVVEDKKKGGYKLSAKEAITREDLRTFHKDLSNHMERVFGRDVGILNEATKEGNKSIAELKRQSATERLQETTVEASKIVSKAQERVQAIEDSIKALEGRKTALEGEIRVLETDLQGRQLQIQEVLNIKPEYEKGVFGSVKGIKGVTMSDIENLKTTAIKGLEAHSRLETLSLEYERVKKLVPTMQERIQNAKDKTRLKELESVFQQLPDSIKQQLFQKTQQRNKEQGKER